MRPPARAGDGSAFAGVVAGHRVALQAPSKAAAARSCDPDESAEPAIRYASEHEPRPPSALCSAAALPIMTMCSFEAWA